MKVSRAQAAENRERILDVAARVFRERGFEGISVTDLMKEAGLTHGGFYGHFTSKEDLMAQACTRALGQSRALWDRIAEAHAEEPEAARDAHTLKEIAINYLSRRHCEHPGHGCAIAALAVDATRQGPEVRHALTEGMRLQLEALARLIPGESPAEKRSKALATYAGLVGALVMARAVDDPALSEEILQAMVATTAVDAAAG